jgi:hypothetical protein
MVLSKLIGREKKRLPKEWLSIRVSQNHTAIYIYIYIYIYIRCMYSGLAGK